MFTGIVQEKGKVISFEEGSRSRRLTVEAREVLIGLEAGDSIAVNGCCLTAVEFDERRVVFDLLAETVRLTSFANVGPGSFVNLEGSLRFNGKIGGHFVTGHIDGTGLVEVFEERGRDTFLRVGVSGEESRYLIYKGSVTIDGVALTVAEVDESGFAVWLIPHTLEVTTLGGLRVGQRVNLEFDLLGKYVERLLATGAPVADK